MGCINSTKKLHTSCKKGNVFYVSVVRLQPDLPTMSRCGILELSPNELMFTASGKEPIVWTWKHVRRYGLNGNIFSFEAGRRCATGPRIYTFRCCKADLLYQKFQRYVNTMSISTDRDRRNDTTLNVQNTLQRNEINTNTNNYLESETAQGFCGRRLEIQSSFNSVPLRVESGSLDSAQRLSSVTEFVHFPYTPSYSNVNPSNIYMEQPSRKNQEFNNNLASNFEVNDGQTSPPNTSMLKQFTPSGRCKAATMSTTNEAQRLYANVDTLRPTFNSTDQKDVTTLHSPTEHCYENLEHSDIPHLLQSDSSHADLSTESPEPNNKSINYIVLDLDNPQSPSQCSNASVGNGQSLSLGETYVNKIKKNESISTEIVISPIQHNDKVTESGDGDAQKLAEICLSYSTIDFIKTCALVKSSANQCEFDCDADPDNEESRITRHNLIYEFYYLPTRIVLVNSSINVILFIIIIRNSYYVSSIAAAKHYYNCNRHPSEITQCLLIYLILVSNEN
uniref:IRS-type PTB domain-containing protein n=1 Tax=Glossina brevipalpis TaxID=37001 RepID=A0A1A9WWC3_9MUSC